MKDFVSRLCCFLAATTLAILPCLSAPPHLSVVARKNADGGGGGLGFDKTGLLLWADLAGDLVNDANPGTNDGVGVNTPGYTTGPFSDSNGAVLTVGGSTDKSVKWTDDASLEPSADFTIVLWVRSNTASGAVGPVVSKYASAPNLSFVVEWQGAANDRFICRYTDDGTTLESEFTAASYPDDDSWMHLAFVYDESADQMVIYKNGVSTSTLTWSTETGAWYDSTALWRLGCFVSDTSASDAAFARFSLWSRTLSGTEVSTLYNSGADVKYADL